jgi:hypothetical protein
LAEAVAGAAALGVLVLVTSDEGTAGAVDFCAFDMII